MALTQDRLMEVLEYDPSSGQFKKKMPPSRRHQNPRLIECGSLNNKGYLTIAIDCARYKAHRLAWLWMTGEWPEDQVDHIDLDKSNNRWANLRAATNSQNQANTRARKTNRAGLKGAHYYSANDCWASRISVNGDRHFLGYFGTAEEAHCAYRAAAERLNPEYGRA